MKSPGGSPPERKDWKDNVRVVAFAVVIVAAIPLVSLYLIGKSQSFQPSFLARVFLYGFTLINLTMLLVLVLVLARNLIKLFLERRRAVLGAKFRSRLVIVFVSFALLPTALIVVVGSQLIRTSVERWFSHPVEKVLVGSQEIVETYYRDKQESAAFNARRLSNEVAQNQLLARDRLRTLFRTMELRITQYRLDMINVYSKEGELFFKANPELPLESYSSDLSEQLAGKGLRGEESAQADPLGGGLLVRHVSPIYRQGTKDVEGAVIASHFVTRSLDANLQFINNQANLYRQAASQKEPIQDLYLSFFLMVSLLVLFSFTWIGLYLAKRITVPVRLLAEATERVMAGDLDHPVTGAAVDELGMLMDSFNRMTAQLKVSQERLERSRHDLEVKNLELDRRRRYTETVLENITTGIVSLDGDGILTTLNPAAFRMLELADEVVGHRFREVFSPPHLSELGRLLLETERTGRSREEEIDLIVGGRELHLSVYVTPLAGPLRQGFGGQGASAEPAGWVIVLDDLSQLLRAQKVAAWREVARRLAHEIKNPLTPIQLSAQRIAKHFRQRSAELPQVVEECTQTIVDEVEALKSLVDEFSQFARMPAVALVTRPLNPIVDATLGLYDGLFRELTLEKRLDLELPEIRVDPELIRRVLINVIDNAIEATSGKGHILVATRYDATTQMVRVEVSDDGPGIPPADREKLFMPYYSTKKRGSGLGLAIVSRIVAEHHGRIWVEDNTPKGTRFVIELPLSEKPVSVG